MSLFIAVAGNIGVGKSTLTEKLAQALGGTPFFEPVQENPYLADFYQDMARWGFHSQLFYLARRLEEHATILHNGGVVVQDRTLYENAEIFARHLFDRGFIQKRDWDVYHQVYQTASRLLRPPDLVIYLQATVPNLLHRIQKRGRAYEQAIEPGYLESLNKLYDNWAKHFTLAPLLTIDANNDDYLEDTNSFDAVLVRIKKSLGGFPSPLL